MSIVPELCTMFGTAISPTRISWWENIFQATFLSRVSMQFRLSVRPMSVLCLNERHIVKLFWRSGRGIILVLYGGGSPNLLSAHWRQYPLGLGDYLSTIPVVCFRKRAFFRQPCQSFASTTFESTAADVTRSDYV